MSPALAQLIGEEPRFAVVPTDFNFQLYLLTDWDCLRSSLVKFNYFPKQFSSHFGHQNKSPSEGLPNINHLAQKPQCVTG